MGRAAIAIALTISIATRIHGEANINNVKRASSFGEFLKPPPPPLNKILPVPFHGGGPRVQRQNVDIGYQYPPPPPGPLSPSANFKFPAPFYRQYNFNFVPPPQPFTTTPSPTMFQKVSNWLFPSGQNPPEAAPIIAPPIKKDCNPCNQVPWIPVIRYDLTGKKLQQSSYPTYGPPSPTAVGNVEQSGYHYPVPASPLNYNQNLPLSGGIPYANYGPPVSFVTPSSTYGPPSPTHSISISSNGPPTSTHISSSTFGISSSSYGVPSSSYGVPSSSYGSPSTSYKVPNSSYGIPSSTYGVPSSTYGVPSSTFSPLSAFGSSLPPFESSVSDSSLKPVTPDYGDHISNYEPPHISNGDFIQNQEPSADLTLPKVSQPTGFKNSYGEPITNNFALDIPYSVSATAAESSKIRTEVLPSVQKDRGLNETFSVAKPSPFSINKGRNIHTLQPVALPNLSVSPLPPIFNARPFRPNTKIYLNNLHVINSLQQNKDNVDISPSLETDISHTVDYPATHVQSPIVDVKNWNQTKSYRKIPSYSIDYFHDVSSQASEDHLASTNVNNGAPESSFESTGLEYDNELFDHKIPLDFRKTQSESKFPGNHKPQFTDLRGIPEDDVDKFRTESNLQFIDSPLLYLKPSAPHKDFDNFVTPLSTGQSGKDYELYDDIPTTVSPQQSTLSEQWDKEKISAIEQGLSPPPISQVNNKKPKVVQIIIPYTTNNHDITTSPDSGTQDWISASADESQGRKVPAQTIRYPEYTTDTEDYKGTELYDQNIVTEHTDIPQYNTHAILNDLYDVKEPPFDIIKFQHNIDDWTEQEYAKEHQMTQKSRTNGKYSHAKKIPDEYFTTPSPTVTTQNYNHNYNYYDYEGSSSIQHTVRDETYKKTDETNEIRNYNSIQKDKEKNKIKKFNIEDLLKPHIYTASSSFRSSTATSAPWEKIQTSISPLTKEKIYVVTSKPWPEKSNITTWYSGAPFESKKTPIDNDVSASDNLPFKSPRFRNRPPSASDTVESLKADSSYSFSKSWHQRINDLDPGMPASRNFTSASDRSEGAILKESIMDEVTIETTTPENYAVENTEVSASATV